MPILGSFPTGHNQDSSAVRNGTKASGARELQQAVGGAPGFSQTLSILGPDRCLSHDSAVLQGTWTTALCPLLSWSLSAQAGCAQGSLEPGHPCTGLEATV